eukprot:1751007-Rhodomonas_salina.1
MLSAVLGGEGREQSNTVQQPELVLCAQMLSAVDLCEGKMLSSVECCAGQGGEKAIKQSSTALTGVVVNSC